MDIFLIISILLSVMLSSFAQIILKSGMSSIAVIRALQHGSYFYAIRIIATNIFVLVGLGLYFLSAVVWLYVLANVDVSIAYPFVGFGFVITMLLAYFILGEALSVTKISGTLLIASGIYFLAKG